MTDEGRYRNHANRLRKDRANKQPEITDTVCRAVGDLVYHDLNRLIQATGNFGVNQALVTHDYSFDAIGNILSKAGVTYCYGYMAGCAEPSGLSRVKSTSDGSSYAYDANGNITSGAGKSYTWNSDNRLDVANGPGGSAVMSYDYTGIRVKKSGTSGLTYFPFTGYEVQGGQVTKYIKLGNEIIASRRGTSRLFYHNDHLGGVNLISDLNGLQVQLNEYDPWGKVSRSEGNTEPTHRFTGQELDPESGIHYYGGRYYDQNLGRFISPDPFIQDPADPQNLNRYSYVINGPQNYIDPTGYFWEGLGDFFSGFFSSFSEGSYQSQVSQAQQNNLFMAQTFGNFDNCNAGACGTSYAHIEMIKYSCDVCQLLELPQNAALRDTIARRNYDRPISTPLFDPIDFIPTSAIASGGKAIIGAGLRSVSGRAATSIVPAGEEIFRQALYQSATGSAEKIAGFQIFGNKGLVGGTFNRNIFPVNADRVGGAPLRGLTGAMETEARSVGANSLSIVGHYVHNSGFLSPQVAQRFGFSFRQIDESTAQLFKELK